MEIKILIVAGVLILIAYVTNVFVTLRSSQQHLVKLEHEIKEAIQKYLDLLPLLLLKLNKEDKALEKQREEWFDNWNNIKKHWPIWTDLNHKIQKLYSDNQVTERLKQKEQAINELVHGYNEKVIKRKRRLKKPVYKAANLKPKNFQQLAN